jgi:putative ABC transport system permease protein
MPVTKSYILNLPAGRSYIIHKPTDMIKNYFKIAWRNLQRNKLFSFINISGLSVGLTCCMLILLYAKDETGFDRFHENRDRLYQLTCRITDKERPEQTYGMAAMTQGPAFKAAIPEIKDYVRLDNNDRMVIKRGNETFTENTSWTDDNFFTVFSFPLISGDSKTALSDPHSVVLSDEMAIKYFGTKDAIGKTLEVEINNKFEPFTVSAIAKKAPQNSSISFSFLLPFKYREKYDPQNGWLWLSYSTFFLMGPEVNLNQVAEKMNQVYAVQAKKEIEGEKTNGFSATFTWGVQPFLSMHLNNKIITDEKLKPSNPLYAYILCGIALFILLIACINFINLSMAQSLKRGKEIGVRKVVGSERGQLIKQFLGESFLLSLFAFLIALVLLQLSLPFFNELANKRMSLQYLFDWKLAAGLLSLFLVTGFVAGFYPAIVLSKINPVNTLYNRVQAGGKNYLAKTLVVLQFTLATFLIISSMFIYSQFNFLTNRSLGYNDKNLLVVTAGDGSRKQAVTFKNEFSKINGITQVAPVMGGDWFTTAAAGGKRFLVKYEHVDPDFLPTLGVPVLEGRNFSVDYPADSTNSVMVNETFVKEAGLKYPVVGKTLDFINGNDVKMTIVGVVKDYHYESLKEKIKPQVFSVQPNLPFGKFLLRLNPATAANTIKEVEKTYRSLIPFHPFTCDYKDDLNYKEYEAEAKWKQIIFFSTILVIFISCIGLFGLTTLSVQRRTKEIGIRKVLGAGTFAITGLVSRNFLLLVMIAFVIAVPAAWYAINQWLQNFPYRINMQWQLFAIASVLTISIAFLTVSFQAIKAAVANPVKSLRTE